MRERRRLDLVRRQLLLTGIARKSEMGALAGAVREEARSAALAERSRTLSAQYRVMRLSLEGFEFASRARFADALAGIGAEAERSREQAGQQAARWQESLASIENRLKRLGERELAARRELETILERRRAEGGGHLARKLLKSEHEKNHTQSTDHRSTPE